MARARPDGDESPHAGKPVGAAPRGHAEPRARDAAAGHESLRRAPRTDHDSGEGAAAAPSARELLLAAGRLSARATTRTALALDGPEAAGDLRRVARQSHERDPGAGCLR